MYILCSEFLAHYRNDLASSHNYINLRYSGCWLRGCHNSPCKESEESNSNKTCDSEERLLLKWEIPDLVFRCWCNAALCSGCPWHPWVLSGDLGTTVHPNNASGQRLPAPQMLWSRQGWAETSGLCDITAGPRSPLSQPLEMDLTKLYKWENWSPKNTKYKLLMITRPGRGCDLSPKAKIWVLAPVTSILALLPQTKAARLKRLGVLISEVKRSLSNLKSSGPSNTNALKWETGECMLHICHMLQSSNLCDTWALGGIP